ncbi:hypothetical protein lerEdw1_014064 [Lerista edwardsae]|nr:hypothetical protein lerEdw1_014064 [Lerista edwardsae]
MSSLSSYKVFPSCVPSFGFRHLLSLTDKVDRFNEEVQKQRVSRNRDAPEGGFDAILQAVVCEDYPSLALLGEKLAENNIHLIFAVTKNHYFLYKVHISVWGIVETSHGGLRVAAYGKRSSVSLELEKSFEEREIPPCILANSHRPTLPAPVGHLGATGGCIKPPTLMAVAYASGLQDLPPLALKKNITALIPGTTVEVLYQDSRNIIQLIVKAYNSIRSKVELTVWDNPEDINLAFTATCQDGLSYPGVKKCGDLQIGDTVSFEISVEARSCPAENTSHTFTIKPDWFRDTLEVMVTYSCTCGCTKQIEHGSSKCSGNGTHVCGLCDCDPGHVGAKCECEEGASGNTYQNLCREAEGKRVCNGRGECTCNHCVCYKSEFGKIYGPFCECDDFSCARYKGVLCSGK